MREQAEQSGGGYMPSTKELAGVFNCEPTQLYDHDRDCGPLYDLKSDGKIQRSDNNVTGDRWCWAPMGMRVSWED